MKKKDNNSITTELKSEYKEYTMGLAVFDLVPVLLFLMSGLVIYSMYPDPLLLAGAAASFAGGLCKAVWKIIVVRRKTDVTWLTRAFHVLMPAGFVLMILSALIGGRAALSGLWRSLTMMPAALFFITGFALMCVMGYLGSHMDSSARSNWIEEAVNALAQLAVLAGVIAVYFGTYYHADAAALTALSGTDDVSVTEITQELDSADGWLFDGPGTDSALVFYPGAKVEASAYAPLMEEIAAGGTDCYLCKMPLNFALLDMDAAEALRAAHQDKAGTEEGPSIENEEGASTEIEDGSSAGTGNDNDYERWYIGGHSLGGAAAAMVVDKAEEAAEAEEAAVESAWDGLILLAAYPVDELDTPVLSIYGSEDEVLNQKKYDAAGKEGLWPEDFTELIIEGGNHAQFGMYGIQKGDGAASIDAAVQQSDTSAAIIRWIKSHK